MPVTQFITTSPTGATIIVTTVFFAAVFFTAVLFAAVFFTAIIVTAIIVTAVFKPAFQFSAESNFIARSVTAGSHGKFETWIARGQKRQGEI
jgi:hypothetical protein